MKDIYIHPDSMIGKNTTIGQGTRINGPAFIASSKKAPVKIGKYCAIAHNLRIRPRNHHYGYPNIQDYFQNRFNFPKLDNVKGPVTIGNAVWIGDNVTILSGVTINDGAIIGAGAVVTKNVPAYQIFGGNPAQLIKQRFNNSVVQQLINIKWWDWHEEKIKKNITFFSTDFTNYEKINIQDMIVE